MCIRDRKSAASPVPKINLYIEISVNCHLLLWHCSVILEFLHFPFDSKDTYIHLFVDHFLVSWSVAYLIVMSKLYKIFTGSIAQSAMHRYLNYSGRFWGFLVPQGRHVALIGVKFGMEEGTKGPLLHAKFQSVQRLGYRSPKTDIFSEIWSKCGI